jgi:hypothetical protein
MICSPLFGIGGLAVGAAAGGLFRVGEPQVRVYFRVLLAHLATLP